MKRSLKSDKEDEGKHNDNDDPSSPSANSQKYPSDDERDKASTSGKISEGEESNDAMERSDHPNNAAVALQPDDNSILFGRGKGTNNRPANRRMRLIIDKYKNQYQDSGRGEKAKLVQRVYDDIAAAGMKFLKPVEGGHGWEEVDTAEAIEKVGHALRCKRGDKRQRELDLPNVSDNNSLSVQRAAGLPNVESLQGPAKAPASAAVETSNLLAQRRNLNGILPLSMQQNLLVNNALMRSAGIPSHASHLGASYMSLSLLEGQLRMNRLMSAASLPLMAGAPFRNNNLSGLSPEQLRLLIEREQQLRLLLQKDSSSTGPGQLPRHPPS